MTKKKKIYFCTHCHNVVESLWNGTGTLVCCNDPMKELVENTVDAAKEKHIPVGTLNGTKLSVKVGSAAHPMDPDHYILCVEVCDGQKVLRHDFKEGDAKAEAEFEVSGSGPFELRAFCNKHGLWKG